MESQYVFKNRYRLFRVVTTDQPKQETWWMDDLEDSAHRSSFCFCLTPDNSGYEDEFQQYLRDIQRYIDRHATMLHTFQTIYGENQISTPTDEADNYTYLKTIQPGRRYEGVHVYVDRHMPNIAELTHMIIQFEAYTPRDLGQIAYGFGYNTLSELFQEYDADDIVQTLENSDKIDYDLPGWLRVADRMAVFILESTQGRVIPRQQAAEFADWFHRTPVL